MELYISKFVFQKMIYIHNNPVEAGIADKPEDYLYCSNRDYILKSDADCCLWILFDAVFSFPAGMALPAIKDNAS